MAGIATKKRKSPAVLKHYEVPKILSDQDFKQNASIVIKKLQDVLRPQQIGGNIW